MEPNYHHYYDKIYAAKDYRGEVDLLLSIAREQLGELPQRVLDVGCGTGTHAMLLADAGCDVIGVDLDEGAIEIANSKREVGPRFYCGDVRDIDFGSFDMAVSLFNVVNYIQDRDELVVFFCEIAARLNDGGVYIFDCWNGLAALADPPQHKQSTYTVDGEAITVDTQPTLDKLNQCVTVTNQVTVADSQGAVQRFTYDYTSRLWTPRDIYEALRDAGLDVTSVTRAMAPNEPADETTWKIMFLCRNRATQIATTVLGKEAA